jgi:hypothetical protein
MILSPSLESSKYMRAARKRMTGNGIYKQPRQRVRLPQS